MQRALKKWARLPASERFANRPIDPRGATPRTDGIYPNDGLVLVESMRDLPRQAPAEEPCAGSWNKDFAWFRKTEARAFLPPRCFPGARWRVPDRLIKRLAAHHFVDYVRCIGYPFDYRTIDYAWLNSTVSSVDGNLVKVRFTGASRTSQDGPRGQEGKDNQDQLNQWRGIEVKILGEATYDMAAEKFKQFDLVALGNRWGGVSASRWEDFEKNPIGFEFRLAPNDSHNRIPPYGLGWEMCGLSDPYW